MSYPENELALLDSDFGHITSVAAWRIMAFLKTGEDVAVLGAIARIGRKYCNNDLRMGLDRNSDAFHLRGRFFRETTIDDPAFFYRLAAVYASFFGETATARAAIVLGGHALDPFLFEASGRIHGVWRDIKFLESKFKVDLVEGMLQFVGEPADKLARFALCGLRDDLDTRACITAALSLDGFGAYAARHPSVIAEGLAHRNVKVRSHVLAVMLEKSIDPSPFLERITGLAASGSKQVRERAEPLLRRARPPQREPAIVLPPLAATEDPELPGSVLETMKHLAKPELATRVEGIFAAMQPGSLFASTGPLPDWFAGRHSNDSPLNRIARLPEVRLTHAVRLLANEFQIHRVRRGKPVLETPVFPGAMNVLVAYRKSHTHAYTTRELAAAFELANLNPDTIGWGIVCSEAESAAPAEWCGSGVEDYFSERLAILDEVFSGYEPERLSQRCNALVLLGMFRAIPRRIIDRVWNVALAGDERERRLAQKLIAREGGYFAQLLAALAEPRPEARAVAAAWLAEIGDTQAIEPLRAAIRNERNEVIRNAFIVALERLGANLDDLLDRNAWQAEAAKGMKSGPPAGLSWFRFDALPNVRWRDSGEVVDPLIPRWLIVQAFKGKSPEPSPLLRQRVAAFHPLDREALGRHVLESWIGQDEPKESVGIGWTYEGPKSAIKEKGILAVAAACAGATAPPLVQRYLKKWYGIRAPQCKALIQMLAGIEHPSAVQLLLATANRFRTASIREEAEAYVKALASRKGWTLDELADRTIPAVGFENEAEMVLDYGVRKFTVRLGKDFHLVITTDDGKPIKSLPSARADEDEEQVQEANKTFADAKKQLQPLLAAQKERLYVAMCTQRTWRFADWDLYLNRHPVISRFCQSLVWQVAGGATFRPLDDGTCTDAKGARVLVEPDASIRIAHACTVPADVAAAWRKHIVDYDVHPLFEQFATEQFTAPSEGGAVEIDAFEGHMLEAFQLRGRAAKLGYTRGQPGDGGWFFEYKKTFPGLGVEAVIGFSGNGLPEENRTVALTELYFVRGTKRIPLREVPPVLVSETWNEVKQIASLGLGFDPDWENKTAG